MKIHQIRNATLVIEAGDQRILLDPMWGSPGTLPPYSLVRFRARMNPIRHLPANADSLIEGITGGMITHTHFNMDCDHLDTEGVRRLNGMPVCCSTADAKGLRKRGLDAHPIELGSPAAFFGGTITAVPAIHGGCVMRRLMGHGVGYVIRLPGQPSLYVTGDTILTDTVREVLSRERPEVCVLPCGSAQLDFGTPILMPLGDILEFVRLAPGWVIANHLECLNHCPTTRDRLRKALSEAGLESRALIPGDGETVNL